MEEYKFMIVKDRFLGNLKPYLRNFNRKQWNNLMYSLQDIMYEYYPKEIKIIDKHERILNPDIKEFVEQTNRRLRNE